MSQTLIIKFRGLSPFYCHNKRFRAGGGGGVGADRINGTPPNKLKLSCLYRGGGVASVYDSCWSKLAGRDRVMGCTP